MAVDPFRANRQMERFLGYRGPDTLYTEPPNREIPRGNPHYPTIGELLLGKKDESDSHDYTLIATINYFPEEKRIEHIRQRDEARQKLSQLAGMLKEIALQKEQTSG